MKVLYVLLAVLGSAQMASAASAGTYVPVVTENLFVPRGFDDNDDIVVTLAGAFPSTCYQLAHVDIKTDGTSNRIQLQQMAYMVSGPCSRMLVPFSNTVHLGRLPTVPTSYKRKKMFSERVCRWLALQSPLKTTISMRRLLPQR